MPADRQIGFIGDELKDLQLCLYTSADFAGDRSDLTSTSRVFLGIRQHPQLLATVWAI